MHTKPQQARSVNSFCYLVKGQSSDYCSSLMACELEMFSATINMQHKSCLC